jgi:hypothetical protein
MYTIGSMRKEAVIVRPNLSPECEKCQVASNAMLTAREQTGSDQIVVECKVEINPSPIIDLLLRRTVCLEIWMSVTASFKKETTSEKKQVQSSDKNKNDPRNYGIFYRKYVNVTSKSSALINNK